MKNQSSNGPPPCALPKLCGADIELGNFISGVERPDGTGFEASRRLISQIDGYPKNANGYYGTLWTGFRAAGDEDDWHPLGKGRSAPGFLDAQDVGRRFLPSNAGCIYIDLNHLELAIPEVLSAYDHLAAWHAMLRIARAAQLRANNERRREHRIQVLINNSDGMDSSYGSHLNFLISRRTFDNIFCRKAHYLQFLASFQVSAIVLTGQSKVGSENGRPAVPYQISQRADFFEILQGIQTTFRRPIVNSRDESLCGIEKSSDPRALARLHVIFFDSAIAHGSALLRVGTMQLILAMIELDLVDARLILDDPLDAVRTFSCDPTLHAKSRLISGQRRTAVELQTAYLEMVKRHAARGVFQGIVPRADEIIALWEDTVAKLSSGDLMALAPRLDWIRKLAAIENAMDQFPGMDYDSPQAKVIDHLYSSLGDDGLYWTYEAAGLMERFVTDEEIAQFTSEPPADTRAWTRAMLLRRAAEDGVEVWNVDWDRLTFKIPRPGGWPAFRSIDLNHPLRFTERETRFLFEECGSFEELLDGLNNLSLDIPCRPSAARVH